jgi:hypothetical protein
VKINCFAVRFVWALTLGCLGSSAAAQTTTYGWRYEAPGEPVVVGDMTSAPAMVTTSDVGTFRRKPIAPSPPAEVVAVTKANPASYRRQEADPRPLPHTAPNPMPRQPMPEYGSSQGHAPAASGAWQDACGCNDNCGPGCGGGCGSGCDWWFGSGRGSWVTGVEYLFARPHFSEPTAYVRRFGPALDQNGVFTTSDRAISYGYDYESSFRAYIAYQLCDCCSEIRFTYWQLDSSDEVSETTSADGFTVPTYFEVQPFVGNTLTSRSDINGNVYDLDCARCIRLGDDNSCCDGCPRWDLQWSVGARLADWDYQKEVFTNVASEGRIDVDMEFIGAGPKVGLEGRRYFGGCNQFAVYSTLDIALVLGWFEHDLRRTTPPVAVNPTTVEQFTSRVTRLVPVTEIELGASYAFAERWTLSAGWFFAAWWDLGMGETQTSNILGGNGPQFVLDDSNIMSWDGLTVRLEFVW